MGLGEHSPSPIFMLVPKPCAARQRLPPYAHLCYTFAMVGKAAHRPLSTPEAEPSPDTAGAATDMPELDSCDLAEFFGAGGPLAQHLEGYELRPSQFEMAQAVKRALQSQGHALIEAPTGTGKSIAYLAPAVLSGKTVIVATANKSLQHQLFTKDIPFLRQVMDKPISAVVVKGRSNYICTLKWEKELNEQRSFALYDREDEQVTYLRRWLGDTETGDVDDLPFVLSADLRPRLVSFPDDCLHTDCRFYHDNCWVNRMRDQAAEAQILVTNHHLLLNALELGFAGERILPPAPIYIVDEAHQLEQTATAVYETNVTDYTVVQLLSRAVYREHVDEDELDELRMLNTLAFQEAAHLNRENSYRIEGDLETMASLAKALRDLASRLKQNNPYGSEGSQDPDGGEEVGEARKTYELGIEALNSVAEKLATVATSRYDDAFVRFVVRIFERRHISLELHSAPVDPANMLASFLFQPEDEDGPVARSVICTSATLATDGHFEHFKRRCGLSQTVEEHVLPAVFDYPRQALLYQPPLPAYDYRNADAYYDGVAVEIQRLLEVSRGRALCLFTSWSGLQQVSDRLQSLDRPAIWPLRAQGDAPRNALLSWFKETPYSVLLATRSFWEGVDIPGDDLSLVILDKLPFPTPGDPLHSARMQAIDEGGGSSFSEYMIPLMTLSLKQGFGRLIRRSTDRGVVAILDERLSSKAYGRRARGDLPSARLTREFKDVYRFFQNGRPAECDFALNVWAADSNDSGQAGEMRWRWQLLRLQDGSAGEDAGTVQWADGAATEAYAAIQGLRNLHARVDRAKRPPTQYGVELRCSRAAEAWFFGHDGPKDLRREWEAERRRWKAVEVLALDDVELEAL